MSLDSTLKRWYLKQFAGMNNKVEENELKQTHAIIAQNCRYEDEPGSATKRAPLSYYNSTSLGANPITYLARHYKSDGSAYSFSTYTTLLKIGTDAAGTWANIKTGLTTGKRASSVVYRDLIYYSNGFDNIQTTDFSGDDLVWEMGSAKAELASGGSNLDAAATYYYAITIDADAYICGAVSNTITTDAGNRKVTLNNIPLGPSGATNRKIFRTEGGGSTLKLLATLGDNTTTTYDDDIADGSLGATMGAVTDDVPVGAELRIHRERLFVARDPNNPNRIYYSNVNLPHFIQQTTNTDYMDVGANDGDEISGIPIQLGVMCCIKKNNIRKLHITTAVSGADPTTWYADDPVSFNGSPAPWSIVQTPYGIIYLGWDHWYLFNGTNSIPIIDEFDTNDMLPADYSDTISFWNKGILLAAYTDKNDGNNYHDRVMRYNWKRKALGYDKINVNCFTSYSGDDESGDLYYGDSVNGFVYRAEKSAEWIRYRTKTQLDDATATEVHVKGTEESPQAVIGRGTIDDLSGTIDNLVGTIDMPDTTGTLTFPSIEIRAGSLGNMYWNQKLYHTDDTIKAHTRTGATQSAAEAASWSSALTNPNGSTIASTANTWIQVKLEFVANSTAGSPLLYYTDGYVVKFDYTVGGAVAETAVEFIYETGFRNFDKPLIDKIMKKIVSIHEGELGSFKIYWYTENREGSFTINLEDNPTRWESFFPSYAFGRKMNIKIWKNDLNDFKIKELGGLYTPEPVLV